MKRTIGIFLAILFCLASLKAQEPESKTKVGFLIANFINVRWYNDKEFFENKVKELGAIPYVRDASNSSENQLLQARELIEEGVKVLVVIPVDAEKASDIVELAHKHDVKVIAYDRLIMNTDLDYYISFNSVKVGEYMAEYVVKLKPAGNYIFINGPKSDHNSILIREGVMNVLDPLIESGEVKLVHEKFLSEWIELDAYMSAQGYLEGNTDVDVVITGGDILARGVLMALEEKDLDGKVFLTGQNGDLQAIHDILKGRQTMTIYKSLRTLGETSAEIAVRVAKQDDTIEWTDEVNNGKFNVPSILFDPVIVDKNNIRETVIADGHLTEEEVFAKE